MDLLLFLNSEDAKKMWLSGDGVLKFSGLIAAGLVKFGEQARMDVISVPGPAPSSSHKLKLTEVVSVKWWKRPEHQPGQFTSCVNPLGCLSLADERQSRHLLPAIKAPQPNLATAQ